MRSKGSLASHKAEKPQFVVMFRPEILVYRFAEDGAGDVRVSFRYNGRKSKGLLYGSCDRYFMVARQRVYLSDLRKVVMA